MLLEHVGSPMKYQVVGERSNNRLEIKIGEAHSKSDLIHIVKTLAWATLERRAGQTSISLHPTNRMNEAVYTSRIIKASALIADTKTLLASWDPEQDTSTNLEHARRTNLFGKASRSRVEDILNIFRQRYFDDPEVGNALSILVKGNVPGQWVDPLLYYYSVKNDQTLTSDCFGSNPSQTNEWLFRYISRACYAQVRDWVAEGKTTTEWGEKTTLRVAQNALAALRDFGVLQGKVNKTITPMYLPVEAFTYLAFEMWRHERSGEKVLGSEDWKLFFLPTQGVERFFLEAHQEKLLAYYAAGSIVRLEFPENNLVEMANALVERSERAHAQA
jgi:hypothetical protein